MIKIKKYIYIITISLCLMMSMTSTSALSNRGILNDNISEKREDTINPQNAFSCTLEFKDVYVNIENTLDVQLYASVDDVTGKLNGVTSVRWYRNKSLSQVFTDKLIITETTRIDSYTINARMKYTIYYLGETYGIHYFTLKCVSPGPNGNDLVR